MKWSYRRIAQSKKPESKASETASTTDSLMRYDENQKMFNYIAPFYDRTNRILSLGLDHSWRKSGISRLGTNPVGLILDVGAGTGDIGLNIVSSYPEATVVGIDTSLRMMQIGLKKTRNMALESGNVFCSANVLSLCFSDNTFDAAITAFCIRNVEDRLMALREIFRVLKSGAKLVIVELTEPQGFIMKPLFRIYSRLVTPTVTCLLSSVSAYDYLTESMADFPSPSRFASILENVGFVNVEFFHLTFGIVTVYESTRP
jgi:demethylmenaquinone methyltransferase/2-methoxy-6-polyprenyl-1,4-benzoquinol methylase